MSRAFTIGFLTAAALFLAAVGAGATPDASTTTPDAGTTTTSDVVTPTRETTKKRDHHDEKRELTPPVKRSTKKKQELGAPQIFGRLHPAFVHLPIAWLLLLFLAEWYALIVQKWALDKWTWGLLVLTLLSVIPTIASGLLRAQGMAGTGPVDGARVLLHRNLMFGVGGAVLLAFIMRIAMRRDFSGPLRGVYCLVITAATALVSYGAHLGAKLVYGKDYLPF